MIIWYPYDLTTCLDYIRLEIAERDADLGALPKDSLVAGEGGNQNSSGAKFLYDSESYGIWYA